MNREFSIRNRKRCEAPNGFNHPLNSWTGSDWFTAILGELGEAANVQKKLNRVRDGIPGNKHTPEQLYQQLRQELADTYIYLDLLAQSCGIDLERAVLDTFDAKSVEIGYVEFPAPVPGKCQFCDADVNVPATCCVACHFERMA